MFGDNKRGHTGSCPCKVDRGLLRTGSVSPMSPSSLKSWTNESLGKREEGGEERHEVFPTLETVSTDI